MNRNYLRARRNATHQPLEGEAEATTRGVVVVWGLGLC